MWQMLIRQNHAISSFIIKPSNEKQTFFISKKDKKAENVSARLNKQKEVQYMINKL